jgi:hypothetical protein
MLEIDVYGTSFLRVSAVQVELATLHSNFTSLRHRYNEEKSKTVELGAELLSLVNAHEALGKR